MCVSLLPVSSQSPTALIIRRLNKDLYKDTCGLTVDWLMGGVGRAYFLNINIVIKNDVMAIKAHF